MDFHVRFVEQGREHVAVLWNEDLGDIGGGRAASQLDFDILRSEGVSNRAREISVVATRAEAEALARSAHKDDYVRSAITKLSESLWSLGIVYENGDYDSGFPEIVDLRQFGRPLRLEGDIAELSAFRIYERDIDEPVHVIAPKPEPTPSP